MFPWPTCYWRYPIERWLQMPGRPTFRRMGWPLDSCQKSNPFPAPTWASVWKEGWAEIAPFWPSLPCSMVIRLGYHVLHLIPNNNKSNPCIYSGYHCNEHGSELNAMTRHQECNRLPFPLICLRETYGTVRTNTVDWVTWVLGKRHKKGHIIFYKVLRTVLWIHEREYFSGRFKPSLTRGHRYQRFSNCVAHPFCENEIIINALKTIK